MNETSSNSFLDFNFPVILHNFFSAARLLIWFALSFSWERLSSSLFSCRFYTGVR